MGGQHRGGTLCVEPRGGLLACVCVCGGRERVGSYHSLNTV